MLNTTTLFGICPLNGRHQQMATRLLRLPSLGRSWIFVLILLLAGLTAQAQKTWVGSTTNWNTDSNWNPVGIPTASDDVVIPSGPTNQPLLITTAVANTVEVQSGASLSITAAGSLTLNGSKGVNSNNNTTAFYNGGLVDNSGQLIIGNTAAVGNYGLWNKATFNNHTGGEISIDQSSDAGLRNDVTFNNAARLLIGTNAGAGISGIETSFGTFNNQIGGEITIDNTISKGIYENGGAIFNYARITIGANAGSNDKLAIVNSGSPIVNSGCSALINIIADAQIVGDNQFSNSGTIIENASGNSSISSNTGIIQNLNGGTFSVGSGNPAITTPGNIWKGCTSTDWNTATNWLTGTVPTASDDVVIPSGPANQPLLSTTAVANTVEVQSGASLSITAAGSLTLNGSKAPQQGVATTTAFYNRGLVDNSGQLIIGNTAAVGNYGLWNQATFNNNTGGEISIDRSASVGLETGGLFNNSAKLFIGANAGVGYYGIEIGSGTLNNQIGGEITVDNTNQKGVYGNGGSFFNYARITIGVNGSVGDYALQNNGVSSSNSGCSAIIVTNTRIDLFYNFSNSGTIIENSSGDSNIGSNTGIIQNLNGGTFTIGSGNPAITTPGNIWKGCTSTDWNTATNWLTGTVPTASDDVVIPSGPANQPLLSTTAVANTVEVQSGASLSITAAGSLTLNGSKVVMINAYSTPKTMAFYNGGLVDNSGRLIIGNTAAVGQYGLWNQATFNNHTGGEIRIDQSSDAGLRNEGPFNNSARLSIGANAGAGLLGLLLDSGTFTNLIGGEITIDNTSSGGVNGNGGSFVNYAKVTLGATGSVGLLGIVNQDFTATFANSGCSALINIVANAYIYGNGNFFNSGTIIENSSDDSSIGSNTGIIQNLNGGTFNVGSGPNQPLSLSSTNASSCSSANGSIAISGLQANTTYTLSYTVNGASSTVSPNPASNASGQFTVASLAAGTYALTLGGTCVPQPLSLSATLSGPASPTASLVSSGTLTCAIPSVTLTASGGDVYQFSLGATPIGSDGSKATVTQQGVYSVTAISANGCSAVASTTVTSNTALAAPSLQASALSTVNQPISVTASGCDGGTINWNPQGGAGIASGAVYTFTQPGNYTLSATCTVSSCTSSASSPVTLQLIGVFTISSVTTVDCTPISANRFLISFNPQYAGITGQPISFEVVNELLPTAAPGPYTLSLYTDNPILSLKATQTGSPAPATYSYNWLAACQTNQNPNTAPQVVTPLTQQTAIVGQSFAYVIPANTFTDSETPLSLQLSAKGMPAGLSFSGATLSGTPSTTVGSPFSVTIIATDPGSLSVSSLLALVVLPASTPVQPTSPFAITSVTTISCTPVNNQINLTFSPQYTGQNGQAISFEVINELAPTTTPAPYSLNLYRDNPMIQLKATQSGSTSPATFSYNWLAACTNLGQDNTPPRVNTPVGNQTASVGQPFSLNLANTFADQETPNGLTLTANGLPPGLNLVGTSITGTPSVSGLSSITLTATDPESLTASTSFMLTVSPAGIVFAISSVQTLSCITVSSGLRTVVFQPLYSGASSDPISFSVVNELAPTLAVGPYSLNLYTDNPAISLQARQGSSVASYVYSWLASCPSGARVGASESGTGLQVRVLGNPVEGKTLEVEIRGVAGQAVTLEVVDLQGHSLHQQRIEQAGSQERASLSVGSMPGVFVLQVSTATQRQVIKLIKP